MKEIFGSSSFNLAPPLANNRTILQVQSFRLALALSTLRILVTCRSVFVRLADPWFVTCRSVFVRFICSAYDVVRYGFSVKEYNKRSSSPRACVDAGRAINAICRIVFFMLRYSANHASPANKDALEISIPEACYDILASEDVAS